jgi:15-cis-phytoene synthase
MSVAVGPSPDVERAYLACEQVTRGAAANFYYGIRLLPAPKRRAMCAVYAFARRIDDIGDGPLDGQRKLAALAEAQRALAALGRGGEDPVLIALGRGGEDPVLIALGDACERFPLPVDALGDLIDGVKMDVEGVQYERFEDLVPYCRRVAGSIGRLCLAIFGARALEPAWGLADDLGVAMQLTNIVRDVREDAANGRLYLPREDLVRYSLSVDGRFQGEEGQFEAFMRFQAMRAQEWFDRGMRLVELLDARSAACVLAMTGIYRDLLAEIEREPRRTLHERVSLPTRRKTWVALRSLAAGALGRRRRVQSP